MGVKSISIPEEYKDVEDYLNGMSNASRYVCQLIRRDIMDNPVITRKSDLKELIIETLEEYLNNKNINIQKNKQEDKLKNKLSKVACNFDFD